MSAWLLDILRQHRRIELALGTAQGDTMTEIHTGNEALELLKKIRINRGRSGKGMRNTQVSNWLNQASALKMGEVLEITDCCEWEPVPSTISIFKVCKNMGYLRQQLQEKFSGQFTTTHAQKVCAVWRLKPAKVKYGFDNLTTEGTIKVSTAAGMITLSEASDD